MSGDRSASERLALAAFVASTLFAGANAVAIRFSNRELAPFWGAGVRFGLAGLVLASVMVARRMPLPRGSIFVASLTYGALNFGAAFGLIYYGLVRIQAGLGMTLLALTPLSTLLLAVLQRQETFRLGSITGALLGLSGIALVSEAPLREGVPLLSLLALIASTVCFGQGGVIVRRIPAVHPVTVNAIGMLAGSALLIAASLLTGERLETPESTEGWIAVGYLAIVGSVGVFVLYTVVLKYWTASRAAYQSVLVPVLTVSLSAWLDDEPVGGGLLLGGAIVLLGVYVGALRESAG